MTVLVYIYTFRVWFPSVDHQLVDVYSPQCLQLNQCELQEYM